MIPKVGNVVYNNKIKMAVIDSKSNEDSWSMSYDRAYKMCSLDGLKEYNNKKLSTVEFNKLGYRVEVKGFSHPEIRKVEGEPPFEIVKQTIFNIRQKKKKMKTVVEYE